MDAHAGYLLRARGNTLGRESEEGRFIIDKLRPSPTMALRRANPHRGLWAVLFPQNLEAVATRDDVDYLVRLDGNPLKHLYC